MRLLITWWCSTYTHLSWCRFTNNQLHKDTRFTGDIFILTASAEMVPTKWVGDAESTELLIDWLCKPTTSTQLYLAFYATFCPKHNIVSTFQPDCWYLPFTCHFACVAWTMCPNKSCDCILISGTWWSEDNSRKSRTLHKRKQTNIKLLFHRYYDSQIKLDGDSANRQADLTCIVELKPWYALYGLL